MNPEIEQAFRDWLANRAYIDGNGNYHRKGPNVRGPIAPWNKRVKRTFADCDDFHFAAHRWEQTQ
jgi:hypothetical protein